MRTNMTTNVLCSATCKHATVNRYGTENMTEQVCFEWLNQNNYVLYITYNVESISANVTGAYMKCVRSGLLHDVQVLNTTDCGPHFVFVTGKYPSICRNTDEALLLFAAVRVIETQISCAARHRNVQCKFTYADT